MSGGSRSQGEERHDTREEARREALLRFLSFVEWGALQDRLARHAESAAGRSAARRLLPALERERVQAFQEATREAKQLLARDRVARLEDLSDLPEVFERRAREDRPFDSRELHGVANTVRAGVAARQVYEGAPRLRALCEQVPEEREASEALADAIERAIGAYGRYRDEASPLLGELRARLAEAVGLLAQDLTQLCYDGSIVLALVEPRPVLHAGCPSLLVKGSELSRVPGPIVHQEGDRYFVQPNALAPAYNALRDLAVAEQVECARIGVELSEATLALAGPLLDLARGLTQCDLHQAMARLARASELRPLSVARGRELRLEGARQPLLCDAEGCVPIDLELPAERRLLLITGPNGGGKTAAMKTLALCAVLAQCGVDAPVLGGALPIYRGFAAVGEPQSSVGDGISTFQAHARDLAEALDAIAPGSLLLLDEIGRGTDPGEASALAQAALEHVLAREDVTVLATTHLPALKRFARERADAACAAVGLDEAGRPTFRLAMGEVGRSYALEAARQAGLPTSLCERAAALHRGQGDA